MVRWLFRLILLVFVLVNLIYAQTTENKKVVKLRKIACDCNQAVKIIIDKPVRYGPTIDSVCFGTQEII